MTSSSIWQTYYPRVGFDSLAAVDQVSNKAIDVVVPNPTGMKAIS